VGADSDSEDAGRIPLEAGRLAGRLLDLREAGRDFGAADRGRELVDLGLAVVALGVPVLFDWAAVRDADAGMLGVPALALTVVLVRLVVLPEAGRDEAARDDVPLADVPLADVPRVGAARVDELLLDEVLVDGRVDDVRRVAGRRALVLRDDTVRRAGLAATGLAEDIDLAAAVSAFAAVIMALVAVFIDFMAEDIVCADAVALVAAAVILVAADVTLVAADDTPLAAVAGEAELRLVRVAAVLRRVVPAREAVERDAVDRDAVLPVDREAVLRVVLAAVPVARRAAVLRAVRGWALDVPELELDGRLAVPLDALRPTDLLRAVLAELRRAAALVVD
jgi:hypothetical protein